MIKMLCKNVSVKNYLTHKGTKKLPCILDFFSKHFYYAIFVYAENYNTNLVSKFSVFKFVLIISKFIKLKKNCTKLENKFLTLLLFIYHHLFPFSLQVVCYKIKENATKTLGRFLFIIKKNFRKQFRLIEKVRRVLRNLPKNFHSYLTAKKVWKNISFFYSFLITNKSEFFSFFLPEMGQTANFSPFWKVF